MSGLFEPELQYWDIKGPQEIDPTRIPEFPASDLLQSIAGQNLKGAAFEVLLQNQERAQQADARNQAFYSLAQSTGIPAAQLAPMVSLDPDTKYQHSFVHACASKKWKSQPTEKNKDTSL